VMTRRPGHAAQSTTSVSPTRRCPQPAGQV
jgi:hypothetical protein